jgi:CMP-N-acetylneuraminic acid synthetase
MPASNSAIPSTAASISFFLPVRCGSQRVISKNTRPFAGIPGGLIELKLRQLLNTECCQEIILSTDDPVAMEIATSLQRPDRIKIIPRPTELCLSTTLVQDLIDYIPTIVAADHIFWLHATAPFVADEDYEAACAGYFAALASGYDSLMSVTRYQKFLWSEGKNDVINFDRSKILWPNTQDLMPLWEINHAFYISSRANFLSLRDRIGRKPKLWELGSEKSMDIDWEEDFHLAETVYTARHGSPTR